MADTSGTYQDFLLALRESESSNRYDFVSQPLGFAGAYQNAEASLQMVGYYRPDGTWQNDWQTGWTGKDGINSLQDFLNNPAVQDKALGEYYDYLWHTEIPQLGLTKYLGTEVAGVTLTESGLLAGAHLVGADGLARFLDSGGQVVPTDPFGTTVATYIQKFNGYWIDPVMGPEPSTPAQDAASTPAQDAASAAPADPLSHLLASIPAHDTATT